MNNFLHEKNEKSAHLDRRQRKSRAAILDAFSGLLEVKRYSSITVQEIIDKANVGRSTFYAHFETKDELLKALCEELFEHVVSRTHEMKNRNDTAQIGFFAHIMAHLRDGNDKLLKLLSLQQDNQFTSFFKDKMREVLQSEFGDKFRNNCLGVPPEYIVNHIACSFVDSLVWWANKHPELTSEQVAGFFEVAVVPLLSFK